MTATLLAGTLFAEPPRLFLAPGSARPQFHPIPIPPKPRAPGFRKQPELQIGWSNREGRIGQLSARLSQPLPAYPGIPKTVIVADEEQQGTLPNGENVGIELIEMFYPTGPDAGDHVHGIFDGATFEPVPDAGEALEVDERSPTLKLKFGGPDFLHIDDTEIRFANGVPFRQNGRSRGTWDSRTKLVFPAPLYSSPAVVVSEFKYGHAKKFTIPLQNGAIHREDDFTVEVIATSHFPPGSGGGPVESGSRVEKLGIENLTYTPSELNDGRTVVCLEFTPLHDLPRYFKRTGAGLLSFHNYDDLLQHLAIEDSADGPVEEIEFSYQQRALAVFQLPGIPGIPRENRDLENIFDLHVPYASFENATDHFWFVANHAGVKLNAMYERRPYPKVEYPISYRGVSLTEMLEDWKQLYSLERFELNEESVLVEISGTSQ